MMDENNRPIDLAYTIFEERFVWAKKLIEKQTDGYTITDFEKLDLITRIATSLFIQKERKR